MTQRDAMTTTEQAEPTTAAGRLYATIHDEARDESWVGEMKELVRAALAEARATPPALPSIDLLTGAYRAAFWAAVPEGQARQRAEKMHVYLAARLHEGDSDQEAE